MMNLDPTHHQNHAQGFDELSKWFMYAQGDDRCDSRLNGDSRCVFRGWALSDDSNAANSNTNFATNLGGHGSANNNEDEGEVTNKPSSFDPLDGPSQFGNTNHRPIGSTHVSLLWWKEWEAEARFKDPPTKGLAGGLRELGNLKWTTRFEDTQEIWMNEGLRVERYLLTPRFWFDLK